MAHRSNTIRIRPARSTDLRSLANLRYTFRAETGKAIETRPVFVRRCERWMRKQFGAKQTWRCWVAEDGRGELAGNIWVELIEKIPNPVSEGESHAYITNFYVVNKSRGKKIGTKLLRAALNWCRRQKVDAVILWPSQRSRTIYRRHGFDISDDIFEFRSRANVVSKRGA
jgi:GNAT superfamily N-acetyltransferase